MPVALASQGSVGFPDYAKGINIQGGTNFIAPQDGIIFMTFDHGCEGTVPIRGKATINGIIVAQNLMGNHAENSPFASFIVKKGDIFFIDSMFGNGNTNVIKKFYPFR